MGFFKVPPLNEGQQISLPRPGHNQAVKARVSHLCFFRLLLRCLFSFKYRLQITLLLENTE